MMRALAVLALVALAGCAGGARAQLAASPCAAGEALHACQVERYHNVSDP